MIFMFIGSVNITLLYFLLKGKPRKLLDDEEFRWFFFFVLIVICITASWILYNGFVDGIENGFRKAAFQVISLISSSGFAVVDYMPWGPFFWLIALTIMFIGGCAGLNQRRIKNGPFCCG